MDKERREQPTETPISNIESFEEKRLFLEAVLAEYKRLADELMTHSKNMSYIFAVMVGGIATILGFVGVIGTISFLLVPIFVSSCGILMLVEGYSGAIIGAYIREEIEDKRLSRLFPCGSPIQYERQYQSRYSLWGGIFWFVAFILSFSLCFGCLVTVTFSSNEVFSSMFYQLIYFFGWTILIFYAISTAIVFFKLTKPHWAKKSKPKGSKAFSFSMETGK